MSDSGYRYVFPQAKIKTLKIVARTRDNVDFLREIKENTKPFHYGAGDGIRTRFVSLARKHNNHYTTPAIIKIESDPIYELVIF